MIRKNLEKLIPNVGRVLFTKVTADEELSKFHTSSDKETPLQYGRVLSLPVYRHDSESVFKVSAGDYIIYSDYYADDIQDTDGYIASVIRAEDIHAMFAA